MNLNVEEILILIVAFLIGWFLRTFIKGSPSKPLQVNYDDEEHTVRGNKGSKVRDNKGSKVRVKSSGHPALKCDPKGKEKCPGGKVCPPSGICTPASGPQPYNPGPFPGSHCSMEAPENKCGEISRTGGNDCGDYYQALDQGGGFWDRSQCGDTNGYHIWNPLKSRCSITDKYGSQKATCGRTQYSKDVPPGKFVRPPPR